MRSIELLSPAKNLDCGIAAINHGADAVYIGASKFGARLAAGNSIQDITALVTYAHKFNARVYAAVNTILNDTELEDAQKLIWQLYEAGTDALIIQDMGILQMDLPPIAIHASTQTDNRTVEKVKFLEQTGFSQVVLARELNLEQIKNISSQTTVPLEYFVHGALCVSYSGQCYISEALSGRSANRGECSQYCRIPYDLVDTNGQVLMHNKHLLSLKDLNLSDYLSELLEAGISSFKIEGRLKEADYVKNITAYYRQKLDAILEGSTQYKKSSSGTTSFFFTPNPEKTFHRGSTSYFIKGRNPDISSFDTPKSVGEYIGTVSKIDAKSILLDTNKQLQNGDGLCFITPQDNFSGFRVNRVEGSMIFPAEMPSIKIGASIYRNYDIAFDKELAKKSAERKIAIDIRFSETEKGFLLEITDEDNRQVSFSCEAAKEPAKQADKAIDTIRIQLSKLGNTDFIAREIDINLAAAYFIPASYLAEWRRLAIEKLEEVRSSLYKVHTEKIEPTSHPYPQKELSYLGNVNNHLAEAFFKQHGVSTIYPSFEKQHLKQVPLMFMHHCLKYSLGACKRFDSNINKSILNTPEPYYLRYKDTLLALDFDCENCLMLITKT